MSNIVPIAKAGVATYADKDLALIRRTVAADCNDDEFNLFIHTARHMGLDPLRRQVYAFVFGKKAKDQSKRRMSIIVAIDGFRAIADRTGNYRPDEDEPTFEIDPALVSPSNPAGLVKASVRVHKFSHGAWHKVTASAWWTEYAPLKEGWTETRKVQDGTWPNGDARYKDVPAEGATKTTILDDSGNWAKMPRLMLAKVAEALALRKAWPDDFSDVYAPEEVERSRNADMLPSEAAIEAEKTERLEKIGAKDTVPMIFSDDGAIEMVPVGKVADRCIAFFEANKDERSTIFSWQIRNRVGLREFWARSPGDSLEVKKRLEDALATDGEISE